MLIYQVWFEDARNSYRIDIKEKETERPGHFKNDFRLKVYRLDADTNVGILVNRLRMGYNTWRDKPIDKMAHAAILRHSSTYKSPVVNIRWKRVEPMGLP